MSGTKASIRTARTAAALLFSAALLALGGYVFAGFLHPDPYVLEKGAAMKILLRVLQIGTIATVLIGLAFIWMWRRGTFQVLHLVLLIVAGVLALLAGYPLVEYLYQGSYARQLDKYHPYLQLTPHTLVRKRPPAEAFTVFALGGSTTEFVDDSGLGWVGRLDKGLKELPGAAPIDVYNAGRQWYTTQHTLINYMLNLRPQKPDLLILMQAVNDTLINADFAYISAGTFRGDYGHFHGPVNRIIRRKTLPTFVGEMIGGLWNHVPRREIERSELPGLAAYERNVRTLLEIAAMDGTGVVLMSEPSLFKPELNEDERKALHLINYESVGASQRWAPAAGLDAMQRYNAKLKDLAAEYGVPFIDLDAMVPKTLEYFYDEVHFRLPAYELLAEKIAQELVSRGVLTRGAAVPRRVQAVP